MKRDVVALVIGYNKIDFVNQIAFEQLCKLQSGGVIDRIVYVTWDSARLDGLLEPIKHFSGVELVRIPEPELGGAPLEKSIVYQIRNLQTALNLVEDDNALVLKTRTDFLFLNENFLKQKILGFDNFCARSSLAKRLPFDVPAPAFRRKVWIPWANATEPLYCSDEAFMGLKGDIAKLADNGAERFLAMLRDERTDRISHTARFLNLFLADYPILQRFYENFHIFISTLDYRAEFAPLCGRHPFFWRLAVLNAWLLETHFHVDGGHNADMAFCSNRANQQEVKTIDDVNFQPPLTNIDKWRSNMRPGSLLKSCTYSISYLADDDWQHALLTSRKLADFKHNDICTMLEQAIRYDRAEIGAMEDAFYADAEALYRKYVTENPPVVSDEGILEHRSRSSKALKAALPPTEAQQAKCA